MSLESIAGISARAVSTVDEPTSEIFVDGYSIGRVISGALLEAAVQCDGLTLLVLTDDVPYEDMLSIHLFDRQWQLLDSARIGAAYATGSFGGLTLVEPNRLHFRFIDQAEWWIEILPAPAFRLPLVSEVKGVTRSHLFSRHFLVWAEPIGANREK